MEFIFLSMHAWRRDPGIVKCFDPGAGILYVARSGTSFLFDICSPRRICFSARCRGSRRRDFFFMKYVISGPEFFLTPVPAPEVLHFVPAPI